MRFPGHFIIDFTIHERASECARTCKRTCIDARLFAIEGDPPTNQATLREVLVYQALQQFSCGCCARAVPGVLQKVCLTIVYLPVCFFDGQFVLQPH